MFYYVTLTQNIDLEPRWFGKQLHRTLKQKLVEKVEGTCTNKYGYIVNVVDVGKISQGKIRQDGSGLATFCMTFSCLAFRPFKDEVVDAVVESVSKMGFFGRVGPMQVFVSSNLMPQEYEYSSAGEASFEGGGLPAVTEGAQAQQGSVADVLEKNGFTQFVALLKRVGAYEVTKKPFTGTILAPTDAAVATFLKDMSLTPADAAKRPQLLDALLSYHVIPYVKGTGAKMVPGKPVVAGTAVPTNTLRFTKDAKGAIKVQDMQGNVANVVKPNLDAGKAVVHGIDRVLVTDRIYPSIGAALRGSDQWDTLAAAVKRAGVDTKLNDPATDVTVFAPNNAAFKALPAALTLAPAQLARVLLYHALPGSRALPQGFTPGTPYQTMLPGATLSVKYDKARITTRAGPREVVKAAFVVPQAGSPSGPAKVALLNVYAGKSIIHGINGLLLPRTSTTTRPAGRRLLAPRGRGPSWSSADDDFARATAANDVTHAAIAAAAQGDVPVDYATDVSLAAQSQVSSIPSYDCWNCASSWSSGSGSYGYSSSSSGRPRG